MGREHRAWGPGDTRLAGVSGTVPAALPPVSTSRLWEEEGVQVGSRRTGSPSWQLEWDESSRWGSATCWELRGLPL